MSWRSLAWYRGAASLEAICLILGWDRHDSVAPGGRARMLDRQNAGSMPMLHPTWYPPALVGNLPPRQHPVTCSAGGGGAALIGRPCRHSDSADIPAWQRARTAARHPRQVSPDLHARAGLIVGTAVAVWPSRGTMAWVGPPLG